MTLRSHALDVSMHVRLFSCEITESEKSPLGCRRINLFCVKEQSITASKHSSVILTLKVYFISPHKLLLGFIFRPLLNSQAVCPVLRISKFLAQDNDFPAF